MMPLEIRLAPAPLDPGALCDLYTAVGWNQDGWRTLAKTKQMLEETRFYAGVERGGSLIGFGRVLADVYVAQILDVITHPEHRRQGIASRVLEELMRHCRAHHDSIQLIDGSGIAGFYERFGFEVANPAANRILYWTAS